MRASIKKELLLFLQSTINLIKAHLNKVRLIQNQINVIVIYYRRYN